MKRFKNILLVNKAGIDQTWALARGVALAEKNQAELSVIEIIPALPEQLQEETIASIFTELKALTEPYRQRLNIHLDVRMGKEFLEVIRAVLRKSHDLVVMGTVARTGIMGLLIGNTAETILDQLDCSVLAVKPEGFLTPVTLPQ
jgi:nucleotide-binding universal stress UspA family protein